VKEKLPPSMVNDLPLAVSGEVAVGSMTAGALSCETGTVGVGIFLEEKNHIPPMTMIIAMMIPVVLFIHSLTMFILLTTCKY
jgi:hypothetical protein